MDTSGKSPGIQLGPKQPSRSAERRANEEPAASHESATHRNQDTALIGFPLTGARGLLKSGLFQWRRTSRPIMRDSGGTGTCWLS